MFPVAVLLLWCRTRGDIKLRPSYEDVLINVPGAELVWGPGSLTMASLYFISLSSFALACGHLRTIRQPL